MSTKKVINVINRISTFDFSQSGSSCDGCDADQTCLKLVMNVGGSLRIEDLFQCVKADYFELIKELHTTAEPTVTPESTTPQPIEPDMPSNEGYFKKLT